MYDYELFILCDTVVVRSVYGWGWNRFRDFFLDQPKSSGLLDW